MSKTAPSRVSLCCVFLGDSHADLQRVEIFLFLFLVAGIVMIFAVLNVVGVLHATNSKYVVFHLIMILSMKEGCGHQEIHAQFFSCTCYIRDYKDHVPMVLKQ
jgi:hypothetical protein